MKLLFFVAWTAFFGLALPVQADSDPIFTNTVRIHDEATDRGKAFEDLQDLTSHIGPRLSGSVNASHAVAWAKAKLESYHLDRVYLQPVQVPAWTRGNLERATLLFSGKSTTLKVTALGGSLGTGSRPIEAEVVEVQGLEEVAKLGEAVRGKIVFYDRAMPDIKDTFQAYEETVDQRTHGASQAAKFGAVAMVMRSLSTLPDDDHPHTGVLHYDKTIAQIPAAALSTHAANLLSAALKKFPHAKLRLELSAQDHPMVTSYNVVGEIRGSEYPDAYVVAGGHLDSWDLATGAQDDGAGAVQTLEVARLLSTLGIHPKRTIRTVLYMAEEYGGFGGREYAKTAAEKKENHIAAIESDRGGFMPQGIEVEAKGNVLSYVKSWEKYLHVVHLDQVVDGGSGTDVEPLESLGAATFDLVPDPTHYFDYHHSALDRMDVVNASDLQEGAAALTVFTYLLSEKGT